MERDTCTRMDELTCRRRTSTSQNPILKWGDNNGVTITHLDRSRDISLLWSRELQSRMPHDQTSCTTSITTGTYRSLTPATTTACSTPIQLLFHGHLHRKGQNPPVRPNGHEPAIATQMEWGMLRWTSTRNPACHYMRVSNSRQQQLQLSVQLIRVE
jgi:hypothetical protein